METYISFDLIIQILCRLPVKSLLRFKCVCKQWRLEINDKNFIKLQLKLSTKTCGLLAFVNRNPHLLSMDLNHMHVREVQLPHLWEQSKSTSLIFQLVGTCNGLICFFEYDQTASDRDEKVVLWNILTREHLVLPPTTREHLVLPTTPNLIGIDIPPSRPSLIRIGFGYDSIEDDYKVIKTFNASESHYTIFYSLRSKSWGKFNGCSSYKTYDPIGSYASGAVHWLALEDDSTFILAYNMNSEKQQILQLPDQIRFSDYFSSHHVYSCLPNIGELEGDLYVFNRNMNWPTSVEVWVMKKYGVKESWTRLFSIDVSDKFHPHICCFMNGNEDLLLVSDNYFVCYNLGNKTNRCLPNSQLGYAYIYRQTLVRILD